MLGLLLLGTAGCSRAFYRRQADREAYALVDCASDDPRWPLEGYTIEPDPRSRMFDPFSPDCPPMPPDDPTAHELMHCVDCKQGWPCWHRYGKTAYVDNPDWKAYLPKNEQGQVVLDRAGAMEMALLHSREYQQAFEELYLSALAVTFERFRLDAQFFGGNSTFFDAEGRLAGGRSLLSTDTDLQMQKLMATGGELVVGVANSLVWQFAGPDSYSANTLLNFSLIQPLLRAGGRAVVLESLTYSERAFLANIRQLERFRRGFYAQIVVGSTPVAGPDRRGVGLSAVSTNASRPAAGYLGLLEKQIQILNQEANVNGLQEGYERLEAAFLAGQMGKGQNRYQVDLALQSLLKGQSDLLSDNAEYQDQLDAYKVTLGLPPDLDVQLEDPLLERFNLITPALTRTQNAVSALLEELRDLDEPMPADYRDHLSRAQGECVAHLETVEQDFEVLLDAVPARTRRLRELSGRPELQQGEVDPRVCDVKGLYKRVVELGQELKGVVAARELAKQLEVDPSKLEEVEDPRGLGERMKATLAEVEQLLEVAPTPETDIDALRNGVTQLLSTLSDQLLQLSLIQAGARLDTITLVPVELASEKALELARENRRDWMNARAALVDSWRQIELSANDLKSGLDVTFSGDINTIDNNPVQFRGTTGRLRVGLEFDAPLTRLAERNAYREALIAYQQTRRAYYEVEDRIGQSLRSRLRTMRLNQLDFEVSRAAVFVAITRVDLARRDLTRPLQPGETSQVGVNAARDVVDGLTDLLAAQNNFLSLWVGYEIDRLNLDLDLGTMQLDTRGMWIDPGPIETADSDQGDRAEEAPPLPAEPEQIPVPGGEPIGPGVL